MHYNFHRYYSPATGRYITADPIGLKGGINLFSYTLNNPINNVDPDGQLVISVPTLTIGGALAIATAYYAWKESIEQPDQPIEKHEPQFNLWDCFKLCKARYPCDRLKRLGCKKGCLLIQLAEIIDSMSNMGK